MGAVIFNTLSFLPWYYLIFAISSTVLSWSLLLWTKDTSWHGPISKLIPGSEHSESWQILDCNVFFGPISCTAASSAAFEFELSGLWFRNGWFPLELWWDITFKIGKFSPRFIICFKSSLNGATIGDLGVWFLDSSADLLKIRLLSRDSLLCDSYELWRKLLSSCFSSSNFDCLSLSKSNMIFAFGFLISVWWSNLELISNSSWISSLLCYGFCGIWTRCSCRFMPYDWWSFWSVFIYRICK